MSSRTKQIEGTLSTWSAHNTSTWMHTKTTLPCNHSALQNYIDVPIATVHVGKDATNCVSSPGLAWKRILIRFVSSSSSSSSSSFSSFHPRLPTLSDKLAP